MTASLTGIADLHRLLAELPDRLESNVLRGAMKAGADVIAEQARENCVSDEVRATIGTAASVSGRVVTSVIQTKGDNAYRAPWLEYGTAAHIIRARDAEGRTARRLNRLARQGSLIIGSTYVGVEVWHPGAGERPFMRPAADQRERDAVRVIGEQIAARIGKITAAVLPVGDDD